MAGASWLLEFGFDEFALPEPNAEEWPEFEYVDTRGPTSKDHCTAACDQR